MILREEIKFYIIKTNSTGDILWEKTYGETESSICSSIQETSDGGYIAVGQTTLSSGPCRYIYGIYIIKTDAGGNALWIETYGDGETSSDRGCSVQETSDGGYIIVGERNYISSNTSDVYLIKIK